jgi:hypothetical protein
MLKLTESALATIASSRDCCLLIFIFIGNSAADNAEVTEPAY